MKNSYSLLFLLIFSIGIGAVTAQTDTINYEYHPLVQEGKMWSELAGLHHFYNNTCSYSTYYYLIYGDTTIDNIEYKKLYHSSTKALAFPDDWRLNSFLREDVSTKRVWQYKWAGTPIGDNLLYDFSLEIGDSIFFELIGQDMVVENITYEVLQDGEIHRIIWFPSSDFWFPCINDYRDCWIEGVGNKAGFLEPYGSHLIGGFNSLLCLHENEKLIYMDTFWNTCYKSSIGIDDIDHTPIKIYPNPASNVLNIDIENIEEYSISIISSYGQIVGQYKTTQNQINISNLVSGIYFVKLSSHEKEYIQKLIINK